MKKLLLSLACLSLAVVVQAQKKPAPVAPQNQPATYKSLPLGSDIPLQGNTMINVDGQPVTLADVKTNRGLLVMFSCNTCPYVIKAQARTMQAMDEAHTLGIGMVVINSNQAYRGSDDSPERMKLYAQHQQYRVPYVVDDNSLMANAFGATRTPEVYLFNGEGKLVYKGAIDDSPGDPNQTKELYLSKAMTAMNAGKPIKPAETKSIGCSIKRADM